MQCWSPDSDEGDLGHLDTFSTNALGLDHQQATHAPVHMLAAYLSARRVPSPHMPHHEHSGPRRPVPARPCPPQVALKTLEPHGHGNVLLDASNGGVGFAEPHEASSFVPYLGPVTPAITAAATSVFAQMSIGQFDTFVDENGEKTEFISPPL